MICPKSQGQQMLLQECGPRSMGLQGASLKPTQTGPAREEACISTEQVGPRTTECISIPGASPTLTLPHTHRWTAAGPWSHVSQQWCWDSGHACWPHCMPVGLPGRWATRQWGSWAHTSQQNATRWATLHPSDLKIVQEDNGQIRMKA